MGQPESEQRTVDSTVRFSAHRLLMAQIAQDEAKSKTRSRRAQDGQSVISANRLLLSGQAGKQKAENQKSKDKVAIVTRREETASPAGDAVVSTDTVQPAAQHPKRYSMSRPPQFWKKQKRLGKKSKKARMSLMLRHAKNLRRRPQKLKRKTRNILSIKER